MPVTADHPDFAFDSNLHPHHAVCTAYALHLLFDCSIFFWIYYMLGQSQKVKPFLGIDVAVLFCYGLHKLPCCTASRQHSFCENNRVPTLRHAATIL